MVRFSHSRQSAGNFAFEELLVLRTEFRHNRLHPITATQPAQLLHSRFTLRMTDMFRVRIQTKGSGRIEYDRSAATSARLFSRCHFSGKFFRSSTSYRIRALCRIRRIAPHLTVVSHWCLKTSGRTSKQTSHRFCVLPRLHQTVLPMFSDVPTFALVERMIMDDRCFSR